jgi:mitogen-activated protein kinase kinase
VRGCLNKIPNLRPTYAMLLQHAWLAPLAKPETITEEDEDDVVAAVEADGGQAAGDKGPAEPIEAVFDKEVADWVKDMIDLRKKGLLKGVPKPALHAAPLDAVQSPSLKGTNGLDAAAPVEATA